MKTLVHFTVSDDIKSSQTLYFQVKRYQAVSPSSVDMCSAAATG